MGEGRSIKSKTAVDDAQEKTGECEESKLIKRDGAKEDGSIEKGDSVKIENGRGEGKENLVHYS